MAGKARIFTSTDKNENTLALKFVRPNQATIAKGDLKYREAYSIAFRNGILVNSEVMKALRERGIWDDEKDREVAELRLKISEMEKKLDDQSLSNEDGEKLALEIRGLRLELAAKNSVYTSIVDVTCESLGNEKRNQFFAATCVVDNKSGAKVFKDLDDFLTRSDESIAIDSYREAVIASLEDSLNVELPSDLTSHYAENRWLANRKKEKEEVSEQTTEEAPVEEPKSRKKKSV
jgi:hypothetical protein